MKTKLILATKNNHKLIEINELLKDTDYEVTSLKELGYDQEIIEDGNSFKENAFIKAKTIYDYYKLPVISDDSGIEIDALNGAPGIYSARFSGGSDEDNNALLLEKLKDITDINKRSGHYTCAVCYYDGDKPMYFEGFMYGYVGFELEGSGGFGYDPLFIVNGKTVATLTMEEKNEISHRAIAFKKLKDYLNNK